MKKYIPVLAVFGTSVAAFAEGEASATQTAVNGILTNAQTALESLVTTGLPIVSALVIAGLTIWGGFKLIRLIMKAFSFGTR